MPEVYLITKTPQPTQSAAAGPWVSLENKEKYHLLSLSLVYGGISAQRKRSKSGILSPNNKLIKKPSDLFLFGREKNHPKTPELLR